LNIAFDAFLYGGFLGSLYYGEIIERRGRRYAVLESMIMMAGGIYVSIAAGNITIFAIGVFFFNAGFRGFYNASLLSLTEVMNEVSRASTPMVLSIGWAFGQIFVALLALLITYWRAIFVLTAVPLTILIYYAFRLVKESPRFMVVKHEFEKAVEIVSEIATINQREFRAC
jgi:MFS family permease